MSSKSHSSRVKILENKNFAPFSHNCSRSSADLLNFFGVVFNVSPSRIEPAVRRTNGLAKRFRFFFSRTFLFIKKKCFYVLMNVSTPVDSEYTHTVCTQFDHKFRIMNAIVRIVQVCTCTKKSLQKV